MKAIRFAFGLVILAAALNPVASQDTVRIRAGAPRWGSNVGVSPLYSIGGPPEYGVRVFYGMAVDNANRPYIFDLNPQEGNPQLTSYDANGKLLRKIGQKGSGPGEYRIIGGSTILEDSILAALDFGQSRITMYHLDGRFLRSISLTRFVSSQVWFSLPSDTANLMYLHLRARVNGPDGNPAPDLPLADRGKHLRMRSDGQIVDSIVDPVQPEMPPSSIRREFVPQTHLKALTTGGLVYGRGDVYRFVIQPLRGPVRVVERDWKPIELTSEERSELTALGDYQAMHGRVGRNGQTLAPPPRDLPKTKPAYQWINVDQDGRIWVKLFTAATKRELPPPTNPANTTPRRSWLESPMYDVFDPSGVYLGNITFPFGSTFAAARGDRVWMMSTGPDDEHLITAYKLTGLRSRP